MRLVGLDYLRGVVAVMIMIYHYTLWMTGTVNETLFLAKVGIYGVSIFYILSGFTLFYVYADSLKFNTRGLSSFFTKRVFRIFPLLWLAITITEIGEVLVQGKELPSFWQLFLNYSGLFSILGIDQYLAVGSWSIGNELVFYLLFPIMLLALRRKPVLYYCGLLFLACLYVYFSAFALDPKVALSKQWTLYIHPLNQAFLFFGGFEMAHIYRAKSIKPKAFIVLSCIAVFVFILTPYSGNSIELVTGYRRWLLTSVCMISCLLFFNIKRAWPALLDRPLSLLGDISYSLYLIHPLAWMFISEIAQHYHVSGYYRLLGIPLSLLIAWASYNWLEKYFVRLGKKMIHSR